MKMKRIIKSFLERCGYQLVSNSRRISMSQVLEHMKKLGLNAEVVVDVGVGYGTPELYETFPHAEYLLIEPIREFEPSLRKITQRLNGRYAIAAAGSVAGSAVI